MTKVLDWHKVFRAWIILFQRRRGDERWAFIEKDVNEPLFNELLLKVKKTPTIKVGVCMYYLK